MMRQGLRRLAVLLALGLGACTLHYENTALQDLQPGWTKAQFLERFRPKKAGWLTYQRPVLRAAQQTSQGYLELFTLTMTPQGVSSDRIPYWFLFANGRLVRWGEPGDWQSVTATHDINFNPGVRVP